MTNARNIIFFVFIFILTKSSFGSTTKTPPSQKDHVVGSTAAAANSAQFVVSLQAEGIHYCTGSILSPNWIVTAAHCLNSKAKVLDTTLVAGSISLAGNASTTQKRPINYYVVNDLYKDGPNPYDIGLAYTAEAFTWSNAVAAVTLPASGTIPSGNAMLYSWDKRGTTNATQRSILQVATVPIVSQSACESALKEFVKSAKIHETNLCTVPPSGAAVGKIIVDSGGPLVQTTNDKNVLIGIVSWGIGLNDAPTVSVLVSSQISWVSDNQVVPSEKSRPMNL